MAIARALLRKPDLIILDEATSSLDPQTERLVQEAIENLPADITAVIIAHRLATIRNVDKVVVLDEGRLVSVGTWEQVLAESEIFQEMVAMQNLEEVCE